MITRFIPPPRWTNPGSALGSLEENVRRIAADKPGKEQDHHAADQDRQRVLLLELFLSSLFRRQWLGLDLRRRGHGCLLQERHVVRRLDAGIHTGGCQQERAEQDEPEVPAHDASMDLERWPRPA